MAIDYNGAALLLSAKRRKIPLGRVLMLGRQNLSLSPEKIASLERQFSVDLQAFVNPERGEEPFAEEFLRYLGATEITSMDFSDYEGSSLCHDLNEPIPDEWKGSYDFVIDGGTLEHIFNFPRAIGNAMELLAPGGHYFASNPADNWLGHGFYQFGPELFFRVFTEENGFEMIDLLLVEDRIGGTIYKVSDPAIAGHRIANPSRKRLESVVLAKKIRQVEKLLKTTPQQSDYTNRWQAGDSDQERAVGQTGIKQMIKKFLPAGLVRKIQSRAIQKRHLVEGARALRELSSMNELD